VKILYLAHRVPFPPNKGEKIRSYHHLRHLARTHEVHLVSFVDAPEDAQWASTLRDFCCGVAFVHLDRRRALARAALSLARGRSVSQAYFDAPDMHRTVRDIATAASFDVVWISAAMLLPYVMAVKGARRVVDFVDVDSEKWREFAVHTRPPLRWLQLLEARRLRHVEMRAAEAADAALFVSAEEAALFQRSAPSGTRTRVVPNGVDTDYFQPADRTRSVAPHLLFTGALGYVRARHRWETCLQSLDACLAECLTGTHV